jgi:hypothetical protein
VISREFITAGRAIFTASNPAGERYTFRVRKFTWKKRILTGFLLGEYLAGSDNESDYRPILAIDPAFMLPTAAPHATLIEVHGKASKVLQWVLTLIRNDRSPPVGYEIRHAGRCGRCGRLLTVPESIESGLGPECSKMKA